jgi:hypothetical protein
LRAKLAKLFAFVRRIEAVEEAITQVFPVNARARLALELFSSAVGLCGKQKSVQVNLQDLLLRSP